MFGFQRAYEFQSTLSVRRATVAIVLDFVFRLISIHALREESDENKITVCRRNVISIHALREESDGSSGVLTSDDLISIHALREESDCATIVA